MTIAHRAIFVYVDKNGTQYSLIPLMESKEAFDYTIPSLSVTIYRGRSESLLAGFSQRWYISTAVLNRWLYPRHRGVKCAGISNKICYRAKL